MRTVPAACDPWGVEGSIWTAEGQDNPPPPRCVYVCVAGSCGSVYDGLFVARLSWVVVSTVCVRVCNCDGSMVLEEEVCVCVSESAERVCQVSCVSFRK